LLILNSFLSQKTNLQKGSSIVQNLWKYPLKGGYKKKPSNKQKKAGQQSASSRSSSVGTQSGKN